MKETLVGASHYACQTTTTKKLMMEQTNRIDGSEEEEAIEEDEDDDTVGDDDDDYAREGVEMMSLTLESASSPQCQETSAVSLF
ncbi:uncharacterized protein MONOS_16534 [Monocercomonoides exilis]|uniref:uncharacterized protein n=1 Tax=Monocercomonoides exilis TaxID=2049356 RepID=UPI00355AC609|nr:hypothetical protein MONOS_16534 [Monocercomonoides exilis]|eukprot:MONOS_16534.1-p1 / transcript=MONOS_16534.1 / gene=MONOS_16534 / organism=Monocercomonoides_exilis_PA203 / gene_product=unspecified product / transcript_product=unspecified product / location=Mono_scaffold01841:549-952(-) / protein_length=84 / sequence_SO=supercontig / SO=protein_coding / is_pseudo=false